MDDLDRILSTYGSVDEYNRVQNEGKNYSDSTDSSEDNQKYMDITLEIVWEPVLECDDDNGKHCCYSTKYNDEFFFVTKYENGWCIERKCSDGEYRPVNSDCEGFAFAAGAMEYFETDLIDELYPPYNNTGGLKR